MVQKCAVFVLNGRVWERRSALKDNSDGLFQFMNSEFRGFQDKEILSGPEELIGERTLPQQLLRELLSRNKVKILTYSPPQSSRRKSKEKLPVKRAAPLISQVVSPPPRKGAYFRPHSNT